MAKKSNTAYNAPTVDQNAPEEEQATDVRVRAEKAAPELIADTFKGTYRTSTALNVRAEGKADADIIGVLNIGTEVVCDGRYAMDGGTRYLHITAQLEGVTLDGYAQVRFLIKQNDKEVAL